jgi:hypothetical protein
MTQKSPSDSEKPIESDETALEVFMREIANNPRFVEAKPSGKAFTIPEARPPKAKG